ncbi:MAG TPA: hypothetical protein VEM95_03030, partial [Thermoplasmata archaeon]|nr:hypothetical protein [Thermoplasmata archaeon]
PNRLQPNPDHGTATAVASVTLSAATGVVTETPVQLTVTATKTAYVDGQTPVGITVAPIGGGYHLCASDGKYHPNGEACPTVATPGLDVLPILAGIGIAAVVAGVAAQRKRRS